MVAKTSLVKRLFVRMSSSVVAAAVLLSVDSSDAVADEVMPVSILQLVWEL